MKMLNALALPLTIILLDAEDYENRSSCIDDALKKILKTDDSKNERPIIFNKSSGDEELLSLLQQIVLKKKNDNFFVSDLDTLWDWDRKNEMKFIYKLLDLMNRNYEIDSINSELKNKYIKRAVQICKN